MNTLRFSDTLPSVLIFPWNYSCQDHQKCPGCQIHGMLLYTPFSWALSSTLNLWPSSLISLLLPYWLIRLRKVALLVFPLLPSKRQTVSRQNAECSFLLPWIINTISTLTVSKFLFLVQTSILNVMLSFSTACLIFLLGCLTGISNSVFNFFPSKQSTTLLPTHLCVIYEQV